jgi:CHASE2 domain-containing sensor protein
MTYLILKRTPRTVVVICLGMLFLLLCFKFDWFAHMDRKIYDIGLGARPGLDRHSDVVIVAIDQISRATCFAAPEFPVSNHVVEHAKVIDKLVAANAKVIVFDILFDQLDPSRDLRPFVSALSRSKATVLASVIERREVATRKQGIVIQEERLLLPSDTIPSTLYRYGLVNVPIDSDQVVRRGSYGRRFQNAWLPSLPVAMVSAFQGYQPNRTGGPDFYIDYSSCASGFQVIPYADVLKGVGWEDLIRGRIALIGVTENSLSDIYEAPVLGLRGAAEESRLPGVFILAYAAETLLGGRLVGAAGMHVSLALGLALIAGSSLLTVGRRFGLSLGLALIIVFGAIILGAVLNALGITILPTGKLLAAAVMTGATGLLSNYWYTRLVSEAQEKELAEISTDLQSAQRIQQRLQPETMPEVAGIDIAGLQIPCKEVGGDYYDAIRLDADRLGLLIADVSGKGITGALLMSNLQSAFRSVAPEHNRPSEVVAKLNEIVVKVAVDGRFVTLFYGILNVRTWKLVYSNAGHNPPFLSRGDQSLENLSQGGLPLGVLDDLQWKDSGVDLKSGDTLLLYTDGVTEAFRAKSDEQFGEERLVDYLKANRSGPADALIKELVSQLRQFALTEHFTDDVTILAIRVL